MTVFFRTGIFVLCALLAGVGESVIARNSDHMIDRTIAKINDDILTESDLSEVVSDIAGHYQKRMQSPFETATSQTVASMFDRALLLQEARRMKIAPPADELNRQVEDMVRDIRGNFPSEKDFYQALASEYLSLDQLKDELLEKTKTDYMVFHVVNTRYSVSDKEVQGYKAEHVAVGESVGSYRLRRLGIPVKENGGAEGACRRVRGLVAQIITDGISFEEGIRKYSQVPGAAADGGDMGYLSSDKLSADVRAAVENLEAGHASAPVIAGGYANIFYVEGKRGARSALREEKFFDARRDLLVELRRKAILQVFDKRLLDILPDDYRRAMGRNSPEHGQPRENRGTPTVGYSPTPEQSSLNVQRQPGRYIPASATPYYQPATGTNYQYQRPAPTPTPRPRGIRGWFGGDR